MTRYQSAYSNSELTEQRYIKECGECGIETIIGTWMDSAPNLKRGTDITLQEQLRAALNSLSELEVAEWAASLVGNPDFSTWLGDQL